MTIITNPNNNAKVIVPHGMIALLHLHLPKPIYYGGGKYALANPEALDFVHHAATTTLKQQWQSFERR